MQYLTQRARRSVHIFTRRPRAPARIRRHLSRSWDAAAHPRPATRRTELLALALLAAAGIILGSNLGLSQTTAQPTSDPLRGERRLLPLDDVAVLAWGQQEDGSFAEPFLPILTTSQNQFPGGGPLLQPEGRVGQLNTFGYSVGRMFAMPRDTFAVVFGNWMSIYFGPLTEQTVEPVWTSSIPNPVEDAHTQLGALIRPLTAMADFTGDGYAEMVIGTANGGLQVATAVDLNDPSQGVRWGDFSSGVNTIAGSALTTGDFDGDGLAEIAVAYPGPSDESAFGVDIFEVDPSTLAVTFVHSVVSGSFPIRKVSITAGDFDNDVSDLGLPDEELVVTASGEDATDNRFVIQSFEVSSTLQPVAEYSEVYTTASFNSNQCGSDCPFVSTLVESARLDWTGPLEQVVVGINSLVAVSNPDDVPDPVSQFWILSFQGDDLVFDVVTQQPVVVQTTDDCVAGMRGLAIGNFDRAAQGQPATIPTSLSIAVLQGYDLGPNVGGASCGQAGGNNPPLNPWVDLWTVDPSNDFSVSNSISWELSFANVGFTNQFMTLLTGDWLGGSLWLGPPSVVPLQDLAQLEIVLQAPPMHLDLIQPVGETSADLLNLSFGLPLFNTKFTESSGTTTSTSHQSTTSNTFAEKESLDDSVSFGIPEVASVSASLKETSGQTQSKVVSKSSTMITSTVESITAASDLDDRLWYTMQDVDLYIYPVLCPPDPSNPEGCGTSPSDVMFSVPKSQTLYSFIPGAQVEWYQPPHQVAQALSYPWTKAQIEALFPTATLDTKLEVDNLPAAGPLDTTFQWTGVGETTDSIGKTRTLSTDTSVSISGDANVLIDVFELGGKSSESFSFSYSNSAGTLNTTETKITGSIGFTTNVPDASNVRSGSNPDYAYDFDVLVFGQKHPACPTSSSDADAASQVTCLYDERTLADEIATQGTLWAGYTIDLSNGGSWWTSPGTDYFTLQDIALSHPQRWVRNSSQATGDNCLLDSISNSEFCYVRSASSLQRSDIWTNEFYQMKGFFVVPAVRDEGGEFLAPQGPQTAVIDADGQVWLQARVHNYSFVATDKNGDGSAVNDNTVHVRFYAQEWDATNHVPLAGKSSILVDEVVLDDQCIPGHSADSIPKAACSNGGSDNWVLATTSKPFDPVAAGIDPGTSGTYVLFWVVAWLEDGSGALVPEVAEHGLSALPGDLTSLTAAASLSQSYGNNIGFFHLPTFVCPTDLDCANVDASGASSAFRVAALGAVALDDDETGEPTMRIPRLRVSRRPVALHAPTEVEALLVADEVSPESVHVALYEGDPEVDGRIFDVELVPYLRANGFYLIRTNYRPDSCGPREITVVADPGGGRELVTAVASVTVSADPRFELAALRSLLDAADLPRKERHAVVKNLRQAARDFRHGEVMPGVAALENLRGQAKRSGTLPSIVDAIEARIDAFAACVADAGGVLAYARRIR